MKTDKVKSVIRNPKGDYTNQKGAKLYCFIVEMENGDSGEYHAVDESSPKFKTGETVTYNVVPIMSKQKPNEVWKYNIKYEEPKDGQWKAREMAPEQQKSIAMQVAYEVAIDYCTIRPEAKIREVTTAIYDWIISKGITSDIQRRACGVSRLGVRMMKIQKYAIWTQQELLKTIDTIFNDTNPEKFK